MRVKVNRERCQGHSRCRALAPQVFEADELGYSFVVASPVPPDLEERVLLAVRNCPERAISIEEERPLAGEAPSSAARAPFGLQ
jgi:ferredoxin